MKKIKRSFLIGLSVVLLVSCNQPSTNKSLPRGIPEEEGVSSQAILNFIEAANKEANEIHSFMLVRHGKVISEGWWKPYSPDLKHTMYSLSKSFTSTAVGFAVQEKLLTVNDKVLSFFPEEVPDTISTNLAQMTVKDLLTMSAGMDPDPTFRVAGKEGSWVSIFLRTPVLNEPGTKFLYNSLATFMLSAIVQKVTGEKLIDYLRPRFFEPLGIQDVDWEVNPQGINTGGWGLRLKTEDIAKAGLFYLQKGKWNGKQLLAEEWIDEATSFKIDQAPDAPQSKKDSSDWMQGYCYQIWRCRHNGYRGDGAYGQYMIVLPDLDAVIAITSQTDDMQKELNLVWDYLLPAFGEHKLKPDNDAWSSLKKRLASLELPVYYKNSSSTLENEISGKTYTFNSNAAQLQRLKVEFNDTLASLAIKKNSAEYTLNFAPGKWYYSTTEMPGPNLVPNKNIEILSPFKVAGSYTWLDNNSVELTLRYIESPHTETITCVFLDNKVGVALNNMFTRQDSIKLIEGVLTK
ncbi:MAG TPA: serine hydrolase [Bacteroidales bacterium]|nr:serine hydrolase [Bacteroidales bacterium]